MHVHMDMAFLQQFTPSPTDYAEKLKRTHSILEEPKFSAYLRAVISREEAMEQEGEFYEWHNQSLMPLCRIPKLRNFDAQSGIELNHGTSPLNHGTSPIVKLI